jgi:hypothetical protein
MIHGTMTPSLVPFAVREQYSIATSSLTIYHTGVVAEEMLHLSLAGNVLRAVGGNPKLYDVNYIPSYPMLMPGRVPKLWLQLRKANKANLQTFIDVRISFTRRFSM